MAAGRDAASDGWTVKREGTARVLAHEGKASPADSFAVAIFSGAQYQDVQVSVRFKATGGARTAGLVWKYQDRMNHYSAQLDLAKQELAVYRVVNGNRIRLEREDDLELDPDAWHSLKVFQESGQIRVYLGGIRVFSERDRLPRAPRQRRALDRRRHHRHVRRLPHRRRNRGCANRPCDQETMRVLVVEDEADLASTLSRALAEAHFAVDIAADGDEAQFMLGEVSYDAVVLDLMVPKRSGWTLLQDLRQSGARTPVLILTALDAVDDRVKALDLGADDYLPKPFAISELVARLRALVRRAGGNPAPVLVVGDITIDRAARLVYRENMPVELTAREYSILELMVRHRGTLVTRSAICEHIYSEASDVFSNVIDVHIAALRRKLGPTVIHTRRGQGYIVNA